MSFFPYCLFVSNSQVIGCEDHLRNDLYWVGWGVKLYSIQSNPTLSVHVCLSVCLSVCSCLSVCVCLCSEGTCNGVAMWMECRLNADHVITSGLTSPPTPGQRLHWDRHSRQAVHLLSTAVIVKHGEHGQRWTLRYRTVLKPQSGHVDLQFTVVPSSES